MMKNPIGLLSILVFSTFQASFIYSTHTTDRFFIIGHQKNDIESAKEAISDGANALEIDLNFNDKTGNPTMFTHGWPCDVDIISQFYGECTRSSPYKMLLEYISQQPELALIILEGKVKHLSTHVQKIAGRNAVKVIENHIFKQGFKGKVVIGSLQEPEFIFSAAQQASKSNYKSQIYFTILRDYSGAVPVIRRLQSLAVPNIIYSIGTITIDPRTYYYDVQLAAYNKVHGAVSGVFIWTLNYERYFDAYYISGVRGIITNNVKKLSNWASHKNLTLAQTGDDTLRPALNRRVISTHEFAYRRAHH